MNGSVGRRGGRAGGRDGGRAGGRGGREVDSLLGVEVEHLAEDEALWEGGREAGREGKRSVRT